MKIETNTIKKQLHTIISWFRRYFTILCISVIALMQGWLILQINLLNRREPSEDSVTETLKTIKRPVIDQKIIDKMTQLEDNSTETKALFKTARDNPFQE